MPQSKVKKAINETNKIRMTARVRIRTCELKNDQRSLALHCLLSSSYCSFRLGCQRVYVCVGVAPASLSVSLLASSFAPGPFAFLFPAAVLFLSLPSTFLLSPSFPYPPPPSSPPLASDMVVVSPSLSQSFPRPFPPTSLRFIPRRRGLCTRGKASLLHLSPMRPSVCRLNATRCLRRHRRALLSSLSSPSSLPSSAVFPSSGSLSFSAAPLHSSSFSLRLASQ